jgi:integrase/recombinase XerD
VTDPLKVRARGPIAPYVDGFREELGGRGYAQSSVVNQLKLVAHLSRWLEGRGLGAEALTVHVVAEYIETRRAAGYGWQPTRQALVPLVGYLRDLGVVAVEPSKPAVTRTVVDEVAERYRCYLRCGLPP